MMILPGQGLMAQAIGHAYFATRLGKRTSGRVLNIGAGAVSRQYNFAQWFTHSEYHTLEISNDSLPTYVADVTNMASIPDASYDWVLSLAVLEHVENPWAAMDEMLRITKPGGFVYANAPFHYEIHFAPTYADYWRFSPFGFDRLIRNRGAIVDIEYWGETVLDPVNIAVTIQKGSGVQRETGWLYEIRGGLDTLNRFIDGSKPLALTIPVHRFKVSTLDYVAQVQDFRSRYFGHHGVSLTHAEANVALFHQAAELEGTIVVTNDSAQWQPAS